MKSTADLLSSSICSRLVEKNADGIVLVDQHGMVFYANPAAEKMFGQTLPGREFGFPVIAGETTEVDLLQPGHSPRVAELRVVEMGKEKKERLYLVSLRDLTERVRMEADLRRAMTMTQQAARAKNRFLSHVSHELRTPLNAVIGFSELLLDELSGKLESDHTGFLREIKKAGRELLLVIDNLLELTDAESGEPIFSDTWLELRPFLANRLSGIVDQAREKGITVQIDWEQMPERICSSERVLGRILDQLLFNAVKFTSAGGEIHLTVRLLPEAAVGEEEVEFIVRDNGVGIHPHNLERIFEPFAQEDHLDRRAIGGLGVGLPLVRKLVERLNGRIKAEIVAPHHGALFRLVIPT